jgi:formylglycine-generating enzyme required for sulfatase activity
MVDIFRHCSKLEQKYVFQRTLLANIAWNARVFTKVTVSFVKKKHQIMKTALTLSLLFLLATALPAQIDCNKFLEQGKKAAQKENFELAMNSFNSARRCGDAAMGELVDKEVTKLFNAINKKKEQAEKEKQRAEEQQKIAEQEKQRAEAQTKIAQAARDSVATLLQKFEAASAEIVDALMREANNLIYHLDYPAAAAKLRTAADLNQPTAAFKKTLAELAFFWNEAGQTAQAAVLLVAAKHTDAPREKADLQTWLQHYAGVWHDTLMLRYYPNMVTVSGGEANFEGKKALVSTFKIARTETTMWQHALYSSSNGQDMRARKGLKSLSWGINGDNPMVMVSWYDAAKYVNWLSKQFKRDTVYVFEEDNIKQINYSTKGYRLPTEVEWEYAARGGSTQEVFEYAGSNEIDSVAWHGGNSGNRTHPGAAKKANSLGLYDMSGNVWEWCSDWFGSYPATFPVDYRGPDGASLCRVVRGGSWYGNGYDCRVTYRYLDVPGDSLNHGGFRLAQHK